MFITFEGINGSGKTTQSRKLFEYLNGIGKDVVLTKEPGGGGKYCMSLREILLKTKNMSKLAELFLLYSARVEHIKNVIEPALKAGKIVICDRYIDSTFAYQCVGDKEMDEIVEYLNDKIKLVIPDITFLIDIPVSVSESRLAPLVYEAIIKGEGYKKYDEIETSNMQKIVDSYRKIATNNSDRVKIIDGTLDKNEIHKKIVSIVGSYF